MGSTISNLIAEIFLQHYKEANIKQLLDMKSIALYVRYVDDILVIYDTTKINLLTINTYINKTHNNIKLNPTYEEHNSITFLDLTVTCRHTRLEVDICRKPTTTNTTINFLSNHPIEQEMSAFRFHITRIYSLPLNTDKKRREWERIQSIAKNNNFPQHLTLKLNRQTLHKVNNNKKLARMTKQIWTAFTFHSPKIRKITNLLKNMNIGIVFKTTTTLHHLIKPTAPTRLQEHEKSEIYKITGKTCHKAYVGQTSRNLKSRFREHIRYIKNNDPRSAYALHILNCSHEYGNTDEAMTLLKQMNTPTLLLPYEQMYIPSFHHNNELILEQHL